MKGSEMAGDKQSVKCNHNRFTAQPKSTLLITFERALHLRAEEEFSASSSGFKDNSSLSVFIDKKKEITRFEVSSLRLSRNREKDYTLYFHKKSPGDEVWYSPRK